MKTFFNKSLIAAIGLLVSAFGVFGQATASGTLTNGVNLLNANPVALLSLQLLNANATPNTVILYDNDSATSTNSVKPAYITATLGKATNTTVITNALGNLQTNNFVYLTKTYTTNSAATNEANKLYAVIVPAGSSVTIEPSSPLLTGLGLNALNVTNSVTYVLKYAPLP